MPKKRSETSVSVTSLVSRSGNDGHKFGLMGFYPDFVQRLATPKAFLICFCVKNILQGMIFSYLVGIETSIERHFHFDGRSVGLLLTLGEIGPILTAIIISHMGSHGNRPRWMGLGLLLIATSLILCYLMDVAFPPNALSDNQLASTLNGDHIAAVKLSCRVESAAGSTTGLLNASVILDSQRDCTIDVDKRRLAFVAWVFIYSLMGIGGTTVYCIGAPYLDDSISKRDSPLYFGITIAVRIIGPLFGYMLSAACLQMYVEFGHKLANGFDSKNPMWIGAWWLGCLIMALAIGVFALVIAAFPRQMKYQHPKKELAADNVVASVETLEMDLHDAKPKKKLKDLKVDLLRLLRNPVLMSSCASSIFTIMGLAGFFIWLPKYFEHEFRLTKSKASMYSGISGNITMIFGVLLSGYLMKRYRPTGRQVAASVAITKYVYAFGLLVLMAVNCSFNNDLPGQLQQDGSLQLDMACNQGCNCATSEFSPICLRGAVNRTYFSPCHAGCTRVTMDNNKTRYQDCRCDGSSVAEAGYCSGTCYNVYVYMVILAVIKFIVSMTTIGNLIIDLRCVDEKDKGLALGILTAFAGLLGFLPNPIIFGTLIDSSCLVWEESCGKTGSCWVYDTVQFRYQLHGLAAGCLMISGVFEIITWWKVKDLVLFSDDK